jgi:urea transporter/murein DD-endopeptidase MepM/ murein hydrolase activator NlpD
MHKAFNIVKEMGKGLLLSYPQIFFSKSFMFSFFLLFITFIFPTLGLTGLICALSSLTFAKILNLPYHKISSGYYGYNALLVGLGIGSYYEWGLMIFVLIIFAGLLTLLIQVFIEGIFAKYRLPILSLPFLFSLWLVQLATHQFEILSITDRGIFLMNNLFNWGGIYAIQWYDYFNNEFLPTPIKYFFISLSSIFFQDNAVAGLFIFIGLVLYSRIAASLSVIGFAAAYGFMHLMGIQTDQMNTFFVGFNFILTAIAIGGFFIIPSLYSYLWVIVLSPLVVILTIGLTNMLNTWQLSVYSLPFNLIVILFLYILFYRTSPRKKLAETMVQEFMPEKNLYSYLNYKNRFGNTLHKIHLMPPFWGEWTIQQAYDGAITHKEQFRHALDFVITYNGLTYKGDGSQLTDYYCYNKLVLSPGYGTVVKIIDNIEDNNIGDVNTINNWGNTIVIKHAEYLYSQLSHLKGGSFKVKEGDFVKVGQPLALVGNSGRSPEPHLHFQVQTYPYVGSPTLEYPFARYLTKVNQKKTLKVFSIPKQDEIIETPAINNLLYKAFHFIPGQRIDVILNNTTYKWEVFTDSFNNTYIYCHTSRSYAYIYNDGLSFYFNSFSGNKKSPLYYFYLSSYRIEFTTIADQKICDEFPLHQIFSFKILFFHDLIAPFFRFIKTTYHSVLTQNENNFAECELLSHVNNKFFNHNLKTFTSSTKIDKDGIVSIEAYVKNKKVFIKFIYKGKYEN